MSHDNVMESQDRDEPDPHGLPEQGRIAGIDFGTVRVGIAICDESQMIASPLETYNRRTEADDAKYFERLVDDHSIVGFAVGLPLHMSGDESQKSLEARSFGCWLSQVTNRPVVWVDERYSTRFANELLRRGNLSPKKRKARLDKVAAQAILSVYLESGTSLSENSLED